MEIVYLLFHLANPKKVYFQMHVAGDKVFGHNYVFFLGMPSRNTCYTDS